MEKVIFTDCFNTILLRKKSEKAIILNWCEKLGNLYQIDPVIIYHFFNKYKINNAVKMFFKSGETEIKFEEIILQVADIMKKNIPDFNVTNFKNDALKTYILAESESHYINEPFIQKLHEFKNKGLKIYVISDFYCNKAVLKQWFQKLNIANLFDDIFVSCDYMASKRTTKLYKKVLQELNINKRDVLMFGDNSYSDIFNARLMGIKAIRIYNKKIKSPKHLKKAIKFGTHYKEYDNISKQFGKYYNFSNHAFPLFLFTRRLCNEIKKKNLKHIFFLSREGMFLKKLFDMYCEITGRCKDVKSHYLEVSRNALYRVNLKPLEKQDFTYLLKKVYKMSVFQFLSSLSFSEEEIKSVEMEMNENINIKASHFEETETYKKLLNTISFKKIYEQKRLEQDGVFDKYLKSFDVDLKKEGLNIVDVGWRGSMQDLMTNYVGKNVKVFGWYVGYLKIAFSRNAMSNNANAKQGLLYHVGKEKFANKCFKPLFLDYEQICRANRSSVYGYKVNNGEVDVIYENKLDENALHKKYILPLQEQIQNKFAQICKLDYANLSVIEPIAAIKHMDIYRHLSRYDVDFYVNAINSHFDNFGAVGIPGGSSKIKRIGFRLAAFVLKLRFLKFTKHKMLKNFYKYIENGNIGNI